MLGAPPSNDPTVRDLNLIGTPIWLQTPSEKPKKKKNLLKHFSFRGVECKPIPFVLIGRIKY